jgi:hypothetical protein
VDIEYEAELSVGKTKIGRADNHANPAADVDDRDKESEILESFEVV